MNPLKTENLRNLATKALMREIKTAKPGANRLPSEEELARELQISRTTIREVMQNLVNEGFITRRHGKGNFSHPSSTKLPHRIDLSSDFIQLLSTDKKQASCEVLRYGYAPPSPAMMKYLPCENGSTYGQFWLYHLAGTPMIFCKISVPEALLAAPPKPAFPPQRLVAWIEEYCGRDAAFYSVHLGCCADAEANRALQLPENTVLPNWQETVYDIHDEPVAFCDLFFHPENADISMVLRF